MGETKKIMYHDNDLVVCNHGHQCFTGGCLASRPKLVRHCDYSQEMVGKHCGRGNVHDRQIIIVKKGE